MASLGGIISPAPTRGVVASAADYFVTIDELSAHNTVSAHEETVQPVQQPTVFSSLQPLLPYTPFVLFALLFVVAFGIQVVNRARNLKNVTTALVLALLVASIPMILTYINQGSPQTAKAGPDEIPREVHVQADTQSSVLILWRTDAKHVGVVKLGPAPFAQNSARAYITNNHEEEVQMHTVRVTGLKKGTTYEFEILSGITWYDNAGKYVQFTFR
jgi:hypothetical protein